jgi:CRP-like cAMP-binding protein
MARSQQSPPIYNQILAALPRKTYDFLAPHLEVVPLTTGQILYHPQEPIRHVYFPNRSTISIVNIMANGSMIEIAVIGNEGMLGVSLTSGHPNSCHQAIVQVPDSALRMKAERFKSAFVHHEDFQKLILRYTHALFFQVAQTASCNRLHAIVNRLARWLLLLDDRIEADTFRLTHEFLATMLGSRRAGVTMAAGKLQQVGAIQYKHGRIMICDREKLEQIACECYLVVREEMKRLSGR